jgi:hypothetical protein
MGLVERFSELLGLGERETGIGKPTRIVLISLLPFLHILACLIVELGQLTSGWMYISFADFPASVFAVAISYNWNHPFVLFWTIGTLWWLTLSVEAAYLFERISRWRNRGAGPA